jgi:uncharacterized protein (DUF302 family)
MRSFTLAVALLLGSFSTAQSDETSTIYPFTGTFDDATFLVESAIIDEGLVIDYVSHTGEMLNRTSSDVGSTKKLFDAADIFVFCSAKLSRKVMEVDPNNIAFCPYSIFVADQGGSVTVGYRNYPAGPMKEIQALLDKIVQEAISE